MLDQGASAAVRCLDAAGVGCILLKGAAVATWLYTDGEPRNYCDIDLLVSVDDFDTAVAALSGLGYRHRLAGAASCEFGPNAQELFGPGNLCIDLHHRLLGIPDSAARSWEVLSHRTVPFRFPWGDEVPILDVPARAMHLALHAAQNGPADGKAIADLTRGLEKVGHQDWTEAARLAHQLGATTAFAAGLRLVPAGILLAKELSLSERTTVELALRTASAPQESIFFERIAGTKGWRQKARLVTRKLFPTAVFLEDNSPTALRSRPRLLAAWLRYVVSLLTSAWPALKAWRRGRHLVLAKNAPRDGVTDSTEC